MWDAATILKELGNRGFQFRFVGSLLPETARIIPRLEPFAQFDGKQLQRELHRYYAWADLFFAPTLEDGFQTVLGQVAASALPLLTTTNGAGRDLVREGRTGWILPIRSPEAFVDRLRWCDAHREEVAAMVQHLYSVYEPRDWSDVAADFEQMCQDVVPARVISTLAKGS
jgi:glycosyltransferase involved in cell wall biosynthesis